MTGTIKEITTNYGMRIPIFDAPGWGKEVGRNFKIMDAVVAAISNFGSVRGIWSNNTLYEVRDRIVSPIDGSIWEAVETHTSSSTGNFDDERLNHPEYWQAFSTLANNRGTWATNQEYFPNEFVQDGYRFGVVTSEYTSGASYDIDVANGRINTLIDFTDTMNQFDVDVADKLVAFTAVVNAALNDIAVDVTNAENFAIAAAGSAGAAEGFSIAAESSANDAAQSAIEAAAASGFDPALYYTKVNINSMFETNNRKAKAYALTFGGR